MTLEVRDGEMEAGGVRVCLMDVAEGFLSLRRSVENALGDVTAILLYNAAFASYRGFAAGAIARGEAGRGEAGFRAAVRAYRESGFGGFAIAEIDLGTGHAAIECDEPVAFEAYGVLKRGDGELRAVCDYTRGALAGLFTEHRGGGEWLCIETECKAKGDARCAFEIGDARALTAKLLRG